MLESLGIISVDCLTILLVFFEKNGIWSLHFLQLTNIYKAVSVANQSVTEDYEHTFVQLYEN